MSQVLIRGLKERAVKILKTRAKANGRSLQAELKAIIEDEADLEARHARWLREADLVRGEVDRQTSDSTDLVREDRNR